MWSSTRYFRSGSSVSHVGPSARGDEDRTGLRSLPRTQLSYRASHDPRNRVRVDPLTGAHNDRNLDIPGLHRGVWTRYVALQLGSADSGARPPAPLDHDSRIELRICIEPLPERAVRDATKLGRLST